jgi:hypothetical protein
LAGRTDLTFTAMFCHFQADLWQVENLTLDHLDAWLAS